MSSQQKEILFDRDSQQVVNREDKVFKKELLGEALKQNIFKTFTMPIAQEINNIALFQIWRS